MPADWWLIVSTPDGQHVWCIGDLQRPDLGHLVAAARLQVGYPAGDGIPSDDWCLHAAPGEPHPTLLESARVGDVRDLERRDPAAVAAYQAASLEVMREQHIEAAKAAMTLLDEAGRETVLIALAKR